jgi:Ca2+-binding RTX toxin-like protein
MKRLLAGSLVGLIASVATAIPSASVMFEVFCNDQVATHVGTDGRDSIVGTADSDVIALREGNDSARGDPATATLRYGVPSDDVICGDVGNDDLNGGNGNDTIIAGLDDDVLDDSHERRACIPECSKMPNDDAMFGGPGEDYVAGGVGDDRLMGGPGADHVGFGRAAQEEGVDTFIGGAGQDHLIVGELTGEGIRSNETGVGGTGHDVIDTADFEGGDVARGGPGFDTCHIDRRDETHECERVTYPAR